jgi:hypothetical protein
MVVMGFYFPSFADANNNVILIIERGQYGEEDNKRH